MNESQYKELWKEICFDLQNSSDSMSEELYEQKIIMSLDKMGWKAFKGEIVLKKSIPIGSAQSIIPDIIVKSKDKNISFVIEVKKPSISLTENNRNQLFSYMRQLKLDFGILFGEKIQIFYDGELNASDRPVQIKIIEFNNNENNLDFLKVFNKESLSKQNLQSYAKKRISIINSQNEKNELKAIIMSPQFALKLREQVKLILLDDWNEEIIDDIMKDFTISINTTDHQEDATTHLQTTRTSTTGLGYPSDRVEYTFFPPDEREFKRLLIQNKHAHIKIFYRDGREEYKSWNASRFSEDSNLRGNINTKTWFRQDYVQRNGVVKAIFSIDPI
jgi:hypothetical protein